MTSTQKSSSSTASISSSSASDEAAPSSVSESGRAGLGERGSAAGAAKMERRRRFGASAGAGGAAACFLAELPRLVALPEVEGAFATLRDRRGFAAAGDWGPSISSGSAAAKSSSEDGIAHGAVSSTWRRGLHVR